MYVVRVYTLSAISCFGFGGLSSTSSHVLVLLCLAYTLLCAHIPLVSLTRTLSISLDSFSRFLLCGVRRQGWNIFENCMEYALQECSRDSKREISLVKTPWFPTTLSQPCLLRLKKAFLGSPGLCWRISDYYVDWHFIEAYISTTRSLYLSFFPHPSLSRPLALSLFYYYCV